MLNMCKIIELTNSQLKSIKNNKNKIIYPISNDIELIINSIDKEYGNVLRYKTKIDNKKHLIDYEDFYFDWSPIQKGDENINIKNDDFIIKKCINIEIIKVKELKKEDWKDIGTCVTNSEEFYNKLMIEMNLDNNYKNNDYIFLIEFDI